MMLQTYTGRQLNVRTPKPEQIVALDIAHALSHLNRFAGHLKSPCSVAVHSLAIWRALASRGADVETQLAALLHDAAEAYLVDLPTPVKRECRDYRKLEHRMLRAVFDRFGLRKGLMRSPTIKRADRLMPAIERAAFDGNCVVGKSPRWIRNKFMAVFEYLQHRRNADR